MVKDPELVVFIVLELAVCFGDSALNVSHGSSIFFPVVGVSFGGVFFEAFHDSVPNGDVILLTFLYPSLQRDSVALRKVVVFINGGGRAPLSG